MSGAGGVQEASFPKREGERSPTGGSTLSATGSGVLQSTTTSTTTSAPVIITSAGGEKEKSTGKPHRGGLNKSFSRSGSFRNKHKLKQQDSTDMSSSTGAGGRGRSPGSGDTRSWRIRNFGYYDIQSVTVDRLGLQATGGDSREQRLKKHTGASAALLVNDDTSAGTTKTTVVNDSSHFGSHSSDIKNELVAVCPAFRNEIGGGDWLLPQDVIAKLRDTLSQEKRLRLCSREKIVLDGEFDEASNGPINGDTFTVQSGLTFPLEFIDYGACYYRNYFYDKEHQNFVGFDEGLGPVVISLKREKISNKVVHYFSNGQPSNERVSQKYQYRVILRTSEIPTLRGTIMEESIPSSIKAGSQRGIPPREVIEYITQGELQQLTSFKLAKSDDKTTKELMRLDEQELNNKYKIGVLYCKAGQMTEEEWYNNETGSPAFDEFLDLIGEKVKMKGFNKYRAQLDNKTDTTGEYSIYTSYENSEMMFHISTLLPFTPANKQQLLRKRHIGNDIVTLIFQEPGSVPFSPKTIRSHFQHIFIVVRVENPNTEMTEYKVAVSRSNDVPYFGPPIPEGGTFQKSEKFRNFLITKLINACNAALHSDKLYAMATRTRKQYLSDLCKEGSTSVTIDQAGGGALGRLFGRKRDRAGLVSPILFTPGAMTWSVSIIMRHWKPLPFSEEHDYSIECTLCLAPDVLTFINSDKVALLHIPTADISGYTHDRNRLNLFYDHCYCISLECHDPVDDVLDFCRRLMALSSAQEAILLEFGRSVISGLLGFTIDQDGTVMRVDGLAKMRGLQKGAQVLQVEDKLVCCNRPEDIADLLHDKNRAVVRAFVIPPAPRSDRPHLQRIPVDWEEVWSLRPQAINECNDSTETVADNNQEKNSLNMSTKSSPPPLHDDNEPFHGPHGRKFSADTVLGGSSAYRRKSRPDHLQVVDPYQDENIYDRLISYGNRGSVSPSAKSTSSLTGGGGGGGGPLSPSSITSGGKSYSRLKVTQPKAIRQSVLHLANNIMDNSGEDGESAPGERYSWTPQPANHQVEEHSPYVNTQVSQSTSIPDRRHTASPLSHVQRKYPSPGALGEKSFDNMPQMGQVHEMKKRFSLQHSRSHRSVSRKSSHVSIVVSENQEPSLERSITTDGRGSRGSSNSSRPLSWDAGEVGGVEETEGVKRVRREERGESLPPPERPQPEALFQRNAQMRQPFRQKTTHNVPPPLDATESAKINDAHSQLQQQLSNPDSPTKALDEVLELFEDGNSSPSDNAAVEGVNRDPKISSLSVRDRTKLWELKAYTQTLPRSFKARTSSSSQPGSPMRKNSVESPLTTPTGLTHHSRFTFNSGEERRDEAGATMPAYYRTRGSLSPSSSPKHRQLQPPQKPPSLATTSHAHNGYSRHQRGVVKKPLTTSLSDGAQLTSPKSLSERHFTFDEREEMAEAELSWDTVMGDITSYCRSVAEWVKQTEKAGVLDGSHSPPRTPPDSPAGSDSPTGFTNSTISVQSEPVHHLKNKVEQLENKLEQVREKTDPLVGMAQHHHQTQRRLQAQESESNKELRNCLKKMEKQISDLQKKQQTQHPQHKLSATSTHV